MLKLQESLHSTGEHADAATGVIPSPLSSSHLTSDELVQSVVKIAAAQKGLDIRALDLRGISDIADSFVVLSGTSERHVRGIADKIHDGLKLLGEAPRGESGYDHGDWIVLDYGNVVVHVFYEPTRQYYEFDELWSKARAMPLAAELEDDLRRLRTGIYR